MNLALTPPSKMKPTTSTTIQYDQITMQTSRSAVDELIDAVHSLKAPLKVAACERHAWLHFSFLMVLYWESIDRRVWRPFGRRKQSPLSSSAVRDTYVPSLGIWWVNNSYTCFFLILPFYLVLVRGSASLQKSVERNRWSGLGSGWSAVRFIESIRISTPFREERVRSIFIQK